MKKRITILTAVLALTAGIVAGCGSNQTAAGTAKTQETAQEATPDASKDTAEQNTQIANPWVEITKEEANQKCTRLFSEPEGAQNVAWSMCESLGDADKGVGPLVQLSFAMDGTEFTARAQQGAAEDADLSGAYYEWTVGPEDVTLANWGGGNMQGKTYRYIGDNETVDLITWYDVEIGIGYSLTASAKDLDGFDIQAIAEQMYDSENEAFGNIPDDFLQEQSGITSFESYDDVIAALTPGQGYAYIKLSGSDEEVLAVTSLVLEADHSAYEISVYGKPEGKVKQLGIAYGNGSSFPLRLEDGIIYAGDNHRYDTYFLSKEYGALMVKDSISDGVDFGTNEISGFTRKSNSFDDFTEFTGGQEEFDKLIAERDKKPIIEFTMIE